jgi:hypothetical protein
LIGRIGLARVTAFKMRYKCVYLFHSVFSQ